MGSSMRWLAVAAIASCSLLDTTSAFDFDAPPQAPAPTSPARLRALGPRKHVFGRAGTGIVTEALDITVAPDVTCGTYTPNTEFVFTCDPGTSCMWENDRYNVAFCGATDFKTACMNSVDANDPDKCDEDCRRNENIQFCTEGTRTECYTIYFDKNIEKYPCHAEAGFSSMNFPAGIESFNTSTLNVAIFPALTTASDEPSSTDATTEGSSGSTTVVIATVTSVPQDNGGAEEDDGQGSGKKSSNVGAIAGGVVGGIAVLVLAGLAVFFIRRRDNKKIQYQPQPQIAEHPAPSQMYYPQQQQHMAPYQDWQPGTTPPPQGWQTSPSPPILQHPAAPVLVEAPDASVAQIHEMGAGKTDAR
ncbi:hypothetical protein F66182_2305 [Fusarium sp. NRRL 66182]|nr:hypothetical protein F66182_2305 [Fusarium sp. NRRL 66182]